MCMPKRFISSATRSAQASHTAGFQLWARAVPMGMAVQYCSCTVPLRFPFSISREKPSEAITSSGIKSSTSLKTPLSSE